MTTSAAITSLRTNAPLRNLVILAVAVLTWAGVVFGWLIWSAYAAQADEAAASPSRIQILSAYFAPVAGCLFTLMLIRVARQGNWQAHRRRFWLGCGFIAGAAVLDLGVTFYFSPDLVDEGNPIVRVLLDSGHSVPGVISHMLCSTLAVVGTFCAFWGAFLAHQRFLLETIDANDPENWIGFLKAATGGADLSLRQWFFPCRWSELPWLYHGIWMAGIAIVFGVTIFRYYVSLEWLGVIEPNLLHRLIALFGGVAGSLILYHVVLAFDYARYARAN